MHRLLLVFLAIAVVLRSTSGAINSTFVVEIIRKLHSVYNFKSFPIFTSSSIELKTSRLADLSQQLSQEFLSPQMYFVVSSTKELRFIINKNALSIVICEPMPTDVIQIAMDRLRGMRLSKTLFVVKDPVRSKRLKFLQKLLWEMQFVNVLVVFEDSTTHQNQIYTINPYPVVRWENQSSISDASKLFIETPNDLKKYQIEVLFMEDVPSVFRFNKNGKIRLVGTRGQLITLFAKYINVKLIWSYKPKMDLEIILREFQNRRMELSVHSYSMFDLVETGCSYPLETVRWCIMVPLRSEVPKSEYVVISFDGATWLLSIISVFYIAFLMQFIDPPTETSQKFYFLRSLAILMYSPNMAERMISPSIRQFIFFAQAFLLGFILSCIYSTYLTSFCTNMVFQPPIDTVDDLVKEHLRVMVIDYELDALRQRANYGEMFLKTLYPVSYSETIKHRNNFDSHYAYSVRQDRWQFLDKQQRGLEKPFFRLSKICFGRHYTMFPLQFDSHLQPLLDNFILLVKQAGLNLYWDEEAFRLAVAMKYSRLLVEQTVVVQQLKLDYFKYVYAGWAVGIGISTLCFAVEIFWMKFIAFKRTLDQEHA